MQYAVVSNNHVCELNFRGFALSHVFGPVSAYTEREMFTECAPSTHIVHKQKRSYRIGKYTFSSNLVQKFSRDIGAKQYFILILKFSESRAK